MADPYVRTVGDLRDLDGDTVEVGVDYDSVTIKIGGRCARFESMQADDFAHLFVAACFQAGAQSARMAEDVTP